MSEFGEQLDWFDEIGYFGLNPRIKKEEIKYNKDIKIKVDDVSEEVFSKFETKTLGEFWTKNDQKTDL